jgi:hypothetical protein
VTQRQRQCSLRLVVSRPKHRARSVHRRRHAQIPPSSWPRVTQTVSLSPQSPQHRDTSPSRPAQFSRTVCLSSLASASHFLDAGVIGSDTSRAFDAGPLAVAPLGLMCHTMLAATSLPFFFDHFFAFAPPSSLHMSHARAPYTCPHFTPSIPCRASSRHLPRCVSAHAW